MKALGEVSSHCEIFKYVNHIVRGGGLGVGGVNAKSFHVISMFQISSPDLAFGSLFLESSALSRS